MTMKQFTTAASNTGDSEFEGAEPITFQVDQDTFTAFPPTASQFALFLAAQSTHSQTADQIAALIDFFNGMLSENDQMLLRSRLMSREDSFSFETVQAILEFLVEEWSARPTQSPQESSSSRRNTGRNSTAKQPSVV